MSSLFRGFPWLRDERLKQRVFDLVETDRAAEVVVAVRRRLHMRGCRGRRALASRRSGARRILLRRLLPQTIPARDVRVNLATREAHESLHILTLADLMDVSQTPAVYAGADQRNVLSLLFSHRCHVIREEPHLSLSNLGRAAFGVDLT